MLDITGSQAVRIAVSCDRKVIWVSTAEDGCVLRICKIKSLQIIGDDGQPLYKKEKENGQTDVGESCKLRGIS